MAQFGSSKRDLYIDGAPEGLPTKQKKELLNALEATGQPFTGSFEEAMKAVRERSEVSRGGSSPVPTPPKPLTREEQLLADQQPQDSTLSREDQIAQDQIDEENAPKTTAAGVLGGAVRGAGPMLTAGAVGALAGSVIPVVGTLAGAGLGMAAYGVTEVLSPFIAKFLNEAFDTKQMGAQEAYEEVYTMLGVENPDTEAEKLAQSIGKNVADAAAMITGASAVKSAQGLGTSAVKEIAEQLAYRPVGQMVGSGTGTVTAEYGGQGAEKLAEMAGVGPRGRGIANVAGQLVGGVVGDMAGTGAMSGMEKRMAARRTPMSAKSAQDISAAQNLGEELTTDELMRSNFPTQKEITHAQGRETTRGGSGEFHYDRFLGNQKKLADEMREFGIEAGDLGNTPRFAEELMTDFLDTRKARLDEFVGNKREVIDRLSETGEVVDTKATTDLIDNIRADLTELDPDEFRGFINKLTNWENVLQDKNLSQIERQRKIIGDYILDDTIPAGAKGEIKKAVDQIYGSLKDGMGNFIETQGGTPDYNKWQVANTNLKSMAEDFDSQALFRLLEEGSKNPDNVDFDSIFKVLTGPNISDARMLYSRLSPEGQGFAKMSLMADIFKKTNPTDLSPNVFKGQLQDRAESLKIVLEPEELERMTGLKKFFDATSQSEDFVRRETGTRRLDTGQIVGSGPLVAHGMRKIGPVGLAIGALSEATIGKAAKHFERPEMRNLMAAMAEVDPGSAAEAELVKRIMRVIGETDESATGEQTAEIVETSRRDQRGVK